MEETLLHGEDANDDDDDDVDDTEGSRTERKRKTKWSMLGVVMHEKIWIAAGCLVLLVRMPFSISMPYFQSAILSRLKDGNGHAVWQNVKLMFLAGTLDAFLDFFCVFLFSLTKSKIMWRLRTGLFQKLLHQGVPFFDREKTGELASRLTSDIATVANDLTWVFRFSIEAIARILGVAGTLVHTNPKLALVTCTVIPLMAAANRLYAILLRENAKKVQDSLARANALAQEVLSCFRTVFTFANEDHERDRYAREVDENYTLNVKQAAMDGIYYACISTFLMNTLVRVIVIGYGSKMYFTNDGEITFEELSRFVFFLDMLQNWCNMLFDSFSNLIKSSGASAKVFDLLNREDDQRFLIKGNTSTSASAACLGPSICFENVHFSYPSRSSHGVLEGVTFEHHPGRTLAVIGKSGSGKSTVLALITRMYSPSVGRVTVDGKDIQGMEHKQLHRLVVMVSQEPVLFSGTIYENIVYSLFNRDEVEEDGQGVQQSDHEIMQKVVSSSKVAQIHGFIESLPHGYHTEVGERGVQLSGGQRQRIAIARAVMANPAVLLLDEATSALDTENERAVQLAIESCMRGRTVVVVAHRLSTIENADTILVMDGGKVVSHGPPSELPMNTINDSEPELFDT